VDQPTQKQRPEFAVTCQPASTDGGRASAATPAVMQSRLPLLPSSVAEAGPAQASPTMSIAGWAGRSKE
jgi:hypothetical protein